jgi:shikimate dehydrogenase
VTAPITLCGSLSQRAVPLGAVMHEAGYRALGLDWRYVPFERDDDLEGALAGMRALGIRGFGISVPFKLRIMPLLDALDPLAAKIGAVNTVVNDGGRLTGHNTDWSGAARALSEQRALEGARVMMLGAGGAARAVAFGLSQAGVQLTLSNRSDDRGAALAESVGCNYRPWAERTKLDGFDVLLNASSAGMSSAAGTNTADEASPMPADAFGAPLLVMDIVYKPLDTQLLAAARAAGCPTVHGGRMLLHQAARQFELYTGKPAPLEAMNAAFEAQVTRG